MKLSYLSLTQCGHACQCSPKNTRENLAATEGCQSSEALVYFILYNFVSNYFPLMSEQSRNIHTYILYLILPKGLFSIDLQCIYII